MFLPAPYHLKIPKGDDFSLPMTWGTTPAIDNPFNLNGWTAELPIVGQDGTVIHTLTTGNSEIVIAASAVSPNITLALAAAVNATFEFVQATYMLTLFDLSNKPNRLMQGRVILI